MLVGTVAIFMNFYFYLLKRVPVLHSIFGFMFLPADAVIHVMMYETHTERRAGLLVMLTI